MRGRSGNGDRTGPYVGWSQSDREELGILRTRVSGIERDIQDLGQSNQAQFAQLNNAITGLATKIEERGRPQWTIMIMAAGFLLAFMTSIGTLAYLPIRSATERLENDVGKLRDGAVTRAELDARSARTLTDLSRLREDIQAIDKVTVPRGEHEEKWRGNDRHIENVQRQIDDLKRFNTDLVSARDFLKNLDDRMRTLERRGPG